MAGPVSESQEQVLLLGPRRSLVGVYSRPADAGSERPILVILNAGILHRVGANRLHVVLARALATLGVPVLRFDLSGVGDSAPREDALPLLDGVLADIREVFDQLESKHGANGFILAGLCSGAMHSLLAGAADPRVKGLIMLDLFVPRTRGFYLRYYLKRSVNLGGVGRFLTGRHPSWRRLRAQLERAWKRGDDPAGATSVTIADIRRGMQTAFTTLLRRDVKLLAAFTSGLTGQHNYRRQLLDAFPEVSFGRALRLEYLEDVDHTFTLAQSRARLLALVTEWIEAEFPGRPAAAKSHATSGTVS